MNAVSHAVRLASAVGLVTALALGAAGCASPGPPRAPSLHLPLVPRDVQAQRRGGEVVLRFETPTRSTDNLPLTQPVTAALCRAVGSEICHAPAQFRNHVGIAGPVVWVDVLPDDLKTGPVRKLSYRVELYNAEGRSAGWSEPVFAAAGTAPGAVEGLSAEGARGGIALRWKPEAATTGDVLIERTSPNEPAPKAQGKRIVVPANRLPGRQGHAPAAKDPATAAAEPVWLRAEDASSARSTAGMMDATAVPDATYSYRATRSRVVMVEGLKLEMRSSPSRPVEVTLRDVFPPAAPMGLAAAGFPDEGKGVAVDLIWQPNVEPDVAGYGVYRQTLRADGSAGDWVKLNAELAKLPAFHDATGAAGMSYRYAVTAVDAKGNESVKSVATELTTAP